MASDNESYMQAATFDRLTQGMESHFTGRTHKSRAHQQNDDPGDANLAERAGFEPAEGYKPSHAFQACDLNRSSTSPVGLILPDAANPPQRQQNPPYCGTFPGVTTFVSALKMSGMGLVLPTAMSEFTMTTITALLAGR